MARLVPSETLTAVSGMRPAEADTLDVLKHELARDFSVYHNLYWTQALPSAMRYGEIDFVVVAPDGRMLIIEQKNGALAETDNGFEKYYGGPKPKSVDVQIQRSIGAIRGKFAAQHPNEPGLSIDCLLYCPDHFVKRVRGSALDGARVVDARQREQLAETVAGLLPGDGPANDRDLPDAARVHAFLGQTFDVVPAITTRIGLTETRFQRLSGGLVDVLDRLDFSPFRLRIQGAPGCGKSVVARRSFADALSTGRRPLYVCFNRRLADDMIEAFPDHRRAIFSFHGLCHHALQQAGQTVDFSKSARPGFWDGLVDAVIALPAAPAPPFDSLIVDEGQDFNATWFDVLQLFLPDDYTLLWLEDVHQDVFERPPVNVPATVTYRTETSYRTPETIAAYIRDTLGMPIVSGTGLPGLSVGVTTVADDRERIRAVIDCIKALRRDGFADDDIVVLTCGALRRSILAGRDELAGVPLRRPAGYGADSTSRYTNGALRFDSVLRFKGGQAPAVILIDVEAAVWAHGTTTRVLYCGMTRASLRLDLFVAADSPIAGPLLRAEPIDAAIGAAH